ncbi:hypothetical protein GGR56DRAFT_674933 [Xylariaceae sp. FL0804]|nr:hypothetical protein GGR56DRAFT_674933 [Xylariaceae sp. FL0804]
MNALDYHILVSLASLSLSASQRDRWRSAAERLKKSYNALLYNRSAGLYRDNATTELHPQDGNAPALLYSLTISSAQPDSVSTALTENWNSTGPISPFVSGLEFIGSTLAEGITANGSLYYRSAAGHDPDTSYTSLSHG